MTDLHESTRVAPSDVVTRVAHAATVEADGEAVVLDELADQVHLLNSTATVVWTCLDGSGSLADIAIDVAEAFGAPIEQVLNDVVTIAQQFVDDGIASTGPIAAAADTADLDDADTELVSGPQILPEPPSP